MCGEKLGSVKKNVARLGSPPHVRGKVHLAATPRLNTGITPACAGKRLAIIRHLPLLQDHPRMCGEKASFI